MTMHIERVEVQDFKRLRSIDISTEGDVITIGGKNAQGKSSLQDAIWNTLAGKQSAVEEPIRQGQSKASATITLVSDDGTGLVATRTWKGDRSTIQVRVKGSKANLAKPQDVLNAIVGPFAFDPMEFATMPEKKRRDALVELVGVDVSGIDERIDRLRAERLLVGRDVKRVRGALDEAEPPAANLPAEFVNVVELSTTIGKIERVVDQMDVFVRRHVEIDTLIANLQREQEEVKGKVTAGREWLEKQPDVAALKADFQNAEATNQAIHAASEYRRLKAELEGYGFNYEAATQEIKDAEAEKAKTLEEANLPLEGLTFDDESVYYNGVPFSQASSAERIRVSVAMAVAHNPELRVVSVKDASLMDEDSLALLKQIAAEHDVQLFLEMVGNGDYTVLLEDGEVKS